MLTAWSTEGKERARTDADLKRSLKYEHMLPREIIPERLVKTKTTKLPATPRILFSLPWMWLSSNTCLLSTCFRKQRRIHLIVRCFKGFKGSSVTMVSAREPLLVRAKIVLALSLPLLLWLLYIRRAFPFLRWFAEMVWPRRHSWAWSYINVPPFNVVAFGNDNVPWYWRFTCEELYSSVLVSETPQTYTCWWVSGGSEGTVLGKAFNSWGWCSSRLRRAQYSSLKQLCNASQWRMFKDGRTSFGLQHCRQKENGSQVTGKYVAFSERSGTWYLMRVQALIGKDVQRGK